MSESQNLSRFLNPWVLHLQKLALELKCPLCLNLLSQPVLLPCNHIFCNVCIPRSIQFGCECPLCKHQYMEREIRQAPFIENVVTIYRSLDATLNAILFQPVSSDGGRALVLCPVSANTNVDKLRKDPVEAHQDGNSSNGQSTFSLTASLVNCIENGNELTGKTNRSIPRSGQKEGLKTRGGGGMIVNCYGLEDMNQVTQLSPGSSPSFGDTKDTDGNSSDGRITRCTTKRLAENRSGKNGSEMNDRPTVGVVGPARDVKRQRKLSRGLFERGVQSDGHTQPEVLPSNNITDSDSQVETKLREAISGSQSTAVSGSSHAKGGVCAFCHSSKLTERTGPMVHYANGKEVVGDVVTLSKVIHVHRKCIEWTPQVYYEGETVKNLESEVARAAKLKCSGCGLKGAALGCFFNSCRRSYHVPCAVETLGCRWDIDEYLMLCPSHKSVKFPRERSRSKKHASGEKHPAPTQIISVQSHFSATPTNGAKEWVLCGSALSAEETYLLVKFASNYGATVPKFWKPNVTHVIAATNAKGACTRTLKVLMAILNGRWILSVDWLKACMEAMHPVDEETYEVSVENHGCCDGPKTGRLRALNNAPKLFDGLNFYFIGDFFQPYKNDLLNLVVTGGGTVTESKEQLMTQTCDAEATSLTLVVYNSDPPQRCQSGEESFVVSKRLEAAEVLAAEIGSKIIKNSWILESIAACKLQPFSS